MITLLRRPTPDLPAVIADARLSAFTGAGGKTSLINWAALILQARSRRVIITTTTKIFPVPDRPAIYEDDGQNFMLRVGRALETSSVAVVAKRFDRKSGKLIGLSPDSVSKLHNAGIADHILVEADGAACKPLKAPNDTEPVIPCGTDLCVAVMGLDSLGRPLDESLVHRSDIFSRITGLPSGKTISPKHLIAVAQAPDGLFKNCPPDCRRTVFLNKADIFFGNILIEKFIKTLEKRHQTNIFEWFAGSVQKRCAHRIVNPPDAENEPFRCSA